MLTIENIVNQALGTGLLSSQKEYAINLLLLRRQFTSEEVSLLHKLLKKLEKGEVSRSPTTLAPIFTYRLIQIRQEKHTVDRSVA
ncbi:MAG: hypothetical protein HC921_14250 [Synechococcaceae cyanobacterium SM2_3_1]|nr:hypothetical protein [Synechococcaceae cyanobacterium SM2_3_1]